MPAFAINTYNVEIKSGNYNRQNPSFTSTEIKVWHSTNPNSYAELCFHDDEQAANTQGTSQQSNGNWELKLHFHTSLLHPVLDLLRCEKDANGELWVWQHQTNGKGWIGTRASGEPVGDCE